MLRINTALIHGATMTNLPAIGLAAMPGRRHKTLEIAQNIEKQGFAGIYCPSIGDGLALCQAIAQVTNSIEFGTAIAPIYYRSPDDYAQTVSFIHEISQGRFRFGIGVAHEKSLTARGIVAGKPLSDTRDFVEKIKNVPRVGELPPIVLAALRDRMVSLSGEIGAGVIFANAARSHMQTSLKSLEAKTQEKEFLIANMIPTCVFDDEETAAAVNRKTLISYARLPNYRNYWKEAGYEEEMVGVERAMDNGNDPEEIAKCLSDRWLSDNTLYGSASKVLEGLEAWYDAGIKTPILVPSSAQGNQIKAIEELFELCARLK